MVSYIEPVEEIGQEETVGISQVLNTAFRFFSGQAKLRSLRHEVVDVTVMLHRETSPAILPAVSDRPVRHGQR